MEDLVLLVPGADEKAALEELLARRTTSLGIKGLAFRVLRHPRRDPGCFQEAPDVLRPYATLARNALVVFDREGSGQETKSRQAIATDLRGRLANCGWGDRAEVVVLDPELEAWVWSDSPHVASVLGWTGPPASPREWLHSLGEWPDGVAKPPRPKECLEAVLRRTTRRFSAAIFAELAGSVSVDRCIDPSFTEMRAILKAWFPA